MSQVRILSPRPLIYNGFSPLRGENAELDPSQKYHLVLVLVRTCRVDFLARSGWLPNHSDGGLEQKCGAIALKSRSDRANSHS
jgi:hypothetical protein